MSKEFSREEFYELVWSKPIVQLAKEFSISDVALHKICRKHGIPNPPLGWWAKHAAGKNPRRIPLKKTKPRSSDSVTIVVRGRVSSPEVAIARQEAMIRADSSAHTADLVDHPTVERTIKRLRKAKVGSKGLILVQAGGSINCEVAPESIDRLDAILKGIISSAARQGFALATRGESTSFVRGEERIEFSIRETTKRTKHEPTAEERRAIEKWERSLEQARAKNEWHRVLLRPQTPDWDYQPTGQLSVEFEQLYVWGGPSPRRRFQDGKVRRLEDMTSDIAVALAVLAATKASQRQRLEERQRRAEEVEELRQLALRAKHVEKRRKATLTAILEDLEQVERLQNLLNTIRASGGAEAEPRAAEFVRWADTEVAQRVEALKPAGLNRLFEEQRLFGSDDDHNFRVGHW